MLVTGASGSIGSAVAQAAATAGWRVGVHGRTAASSAAALERLVAAAPEAEGFAVGADLTDAAGAAQAVGAVEQRFGRLDAVVNCAVSAPPGVTGRFMATDPTTYTDLCHHAVSQLQWLARAALPAMERSGGGSLVALASDAGRFAAPGQSLIAATRAAIMAFCRNLALEAAQTGVRVNCVSMSYVEGTAIVERSEAVGGSRIATARSRAGLGLPNAADIANLCLFLIGGGSARITGQVIGVNGGLNA